MNKILMGIGAGLLVTLASLHPLVAAEFANLPDEPSIYRIEVHTLKPGAGPSYEAAVKGLIAALKVANINLPTWDFSVVSGDHDVYMTIDPSERWADLDRFDSDGEAAMKALGPGMERFYHDAHAALLRESDLFIETEPAKSDPGAIGENGLNHLHVDVFHAASPRAVAADLRAIQKIYRDAHSPVSCRLYRVVTGDDLPMIILLRSAPGHTRYLEDARLSEPQQTNVEALLADARRNSRKTQMMDLTVRPDLSYHVKVSH
jgi:hypothetical protein